MDIGPDVTLAEALGSFGPGISLEKKIVQCLPVEKKSCCSIELMGSIERFKIKSMLLLIARNA